MPTPRGGGVAIVLTLTAGVMLIYWGQYLDAGLMLTLVGGGLAVAIVGLFDDLRSVSVFLRLIVHLLAAAWAVQNLSDGPLLQIGSRVVELNGVWHIVCILAIVWVVNLFNFMDGIDGLAASEASFIAIGFALLSALAGAAAGLPLIAIVLAASCLGFMYWNWPPARVFLGDVGSGYLGYVISVLALSAAIENPAALFAVLILGAFFFVDATATLARRLLRGERAFAAHRSHAYQWLARRSGSHRKVTVLVTLVNVAVLLPLAVWSTLRPSEAVWITVGALLVLLVALLWFGAGRAETTGGKE
jgi:Fuc2NAc and GlcNAc transferase